jgi:hypothetical protein
MREIEMALPWSSAHSGASSQVIQRGNVTNSLILMGGKATVPHKDVLDPNRRLVPHAELTNT